MGTSTKLSLAAGSFLSVLLIAACGGGGSAFVPPTPSPPCKPSLTGAAPAHLYAPGPPGFRVYQLPLSPSGLSSPVAEVNQGNFSTSAVVVSNNKLYAAGIDDTTGIENHILVYSLPITSSSTPIQTLTTSSSPGGQTFNLAADSHGFVYAIVEAVPLGGRHVPGVAVFPPGATSPSFTLISSCIGCSNTVQDPFGLTVDSGGNLFLNNNYPNIGYFAAPVQAGEAGFTFQRPYPADGIFLPYSIATDSCDNVYSVGNEPFKGGMMYIYHPPYTPISTPASILRFPDFFFWGQIASDGTMYLMGYNHRGQSAIFVLLPPYTAVKYAVNYLGGLWVAVGP